MPQAKVLTEEQISHVLEVIDQRAWYPTRDKLMVLLGFCQGMRAMEIANLDFCDVTDAEGELDTWIRIEKHATKGAMTYGRRRTLPLHPTVRAVLQDHFDRRIAEWGEADGPVFINQYGRQMTPSAVQWQVGNLYRKAGLRGTSSHSGRRSFITDKARKLPLYGASIRDLQALAGHADMKPTEQYIESSSNQWALVMSPWLNGDAIVPADAAAVPEPGRLRPVLPIRSVPVKRPGSSMKSQHEPRSRDDYERVRINGGWISVPKMTVGDTGLTIAAILKGRHRTAENGEQEVVASARKPALPKRLPPERR